MQGKSIFRQVAENFNPLDIMTLGYLTVTLVYILFSSNKLSGEWTHILFRVVVIALICGLSYYTQSIHNRFGLFFRNIYPFLLFGTFYSETDYLNNVLFNNLDPFVEKFELWIFGVHPSVIFSESLPQKWFSELMNLGYFSYYILILLLPLWLFLKRRESFYYVAFTIATSFYLFYIFFILFPVAGPQFHLAESLRAIPDSGVFREMVKFAERLGEGPTAAFPSSHVGIMVIMALLTSRFAKELLVVYFVFGLLICFSTVYIKAHYLIDVFGGILFAPLIYLICNRIYKCFSRRLPQT